ncbi:MAG: VOC family protein [Cyanobacteria bacterium J06626_23]
MDFHHLHFYVDDARRWGEWFVKTLQFTWIRLERQALSCTVWLRQGAVRVRLSSPTAERGPVADYLSVHPPGIVDIAFAVADLPTTLQQVLRRGARLRRPPEWGCLGDLTSQSAQVTGWAGLSHTLVQCDPIANTTHSEVWIEGIDHAVLNVPKGDLTVTAAWYRDTFGFQLQQQFTIQTPTSGLYSQVLIHPDGNAQLPINEPSTANSQIQEFLSVNRGAGVQHVALRTGDLVGAIAALRTQKLSLLSVPASYYQQLVQRPGYHPQAADWQAIAQQQILVDWPPEQPQAMLLQTFTDPIFEQPTFFFELIERRRYVEAGQVKVPLGFGEGNFQALFEAMERDQYRRGALTPERASATAKSC